LETTGPADYHAWCRVFLEGFEVPRDMHAVMYEMNLQSLRHPQVTGLLGVLNGEPVATTCLFTEGDTAGLYAVSTAPKARRRGVAGAMVRRALDLAKEKGASLAVLQTGTGGAPERLYRTLGFRDLYVAEVLTRRG
ncbi:MAG: GNAT family N-acetyltransferase, partial [Bacillota bacterium]